MLLGYLYVTMAKILDGILQADGKVWHHCTTWVSSTGRVSVSLTGRDKLWPNRDIAKC